MLTDDERKQLVLDIIEKRGADPQETITLAEEAELNNKLAEFLSRRDASTRCHRDDGAPCLYPQLVPVCRRIEPAYAGRLALSTMQLVVQRYRCLHCGAYAVAAIERAG